MKRTTLLTLTAIGLILAIPAQALEARNYGNRIIVKFKTDNGKARIMSADNLADLSVTAGQPLHYRRTTGGGEQVLEVLQGDTRPQTLENMAASLNQRPDVEYAEVDYKRYPAAFPSTAPNDALYADKQWYLQDNSTASNKGAANINAVWAKGLTGTGVTVAVVDTGITAHKDLGSNIIPGYDFISLDSSGRSDTDGDSSPGRDADATDSGDLVTQNDKDNIATFRDDPHCSASVDGKSSWHGTTVSGVIGAQTDNAEGIAGVAPGAKVVVSRALGKCGGYNSDLMDAARWSAGIRVSGVPDNANPAKIVNLSLGSRGNCSLTEQSAINAIVAKGAVIIVAAGNNAGDASKSSPGNCNQVINVGANTRRGGQTRYTNVGEEVTISAPGGNAPFSFVLTTSQSKAAGTIAPTDNIYKKVQGTSFSAPIVSGIIALMLQRDNDLTPAQIKSLITTHATPFPTGTSTGAKGGDAVQDCTTANCGAGIINAKLIIEAINNNNGKGGGGATMPLWLFSLLLLRFYLRRSNCR